MRLETMVASPGEWIVISGGAPHSTDLTAQMVKLNDMIIPAYVDGKDLLVRCPNFKGRSTIDVTVRGLSLGKVEISR